MDFEKGTKNKIFLILKADYKNCIDVSSNKFNDDKHCMG